MKSLFKLLALVLCNSRKPDPHKLKMAPTKATSDDEFNLDEFINNKFNLLDIEFKNSMSQKIVFYSLGYYGSMGDLVKFHTNMIHSFYNINDKDILQVTLFALPSMIPWFGSISLELGPRVVDFCKEVALYGDLLRLTHLSTFTQEKRLEWIYSASNLSIPAQVALITYFLILAMKMTGKRLDRFNLEIPERFVWSGITREDVTTYLVIMQTIADSMMKGNRLRLRPFLNNWEKVDRFANLNKMKKDLDKVISEF